MYVINLYKLVSSHHVAHVYEHVAYMHIDTWLRDKGLFNPIDFSFDASTQNGLIHLNFEIYNDELLLKPELLNKVLSLRIDFIAPQTALAVKQVQSEYGQEYIIQNVELFVHDLQKIDNESWQEKQGANIVVNDENIYMGEKIALQHVVISCDLLQVKEQMRPLHRQIAGLITNAVSSDIADTYGGFITSKMFQVNNHVLEGIVQFDRMTVIEEHDLQRLLRETMSELEEQGGFERLLYLLQHTESAFMPPSPERTFADTGVYVDARVWQQMATSKNLQEVLQNIHFDINIE